MFYQLHTLSPHGIAVAVLDIAIVAFVIYKVLILIRATRAVQLLKGIIILIIATVVSQRMNLVTVSWLLEKTMVMLLVALPIVFQPELRRGLEQLGRGRFFRPQSLSRFDVETTVKDTVTAAVILAHRRRGALVVFERNTGLGDIVDGGVSVDGCLSTELLVNLFLADGPLHDGAVIVRAGRILAAGCFLPLSETVPPGSSWGARHRAAVGVSEHSDAVAVVVSEETGSMTVAIDGELSGALDREELTAVLVQACKGSSNRARWRDHGGE